MTAMSWQLALILMTLLLVLVTRGTLEMADQSAVVQTLHLLIMISVTIINIAFIKYSFP